MNSFDEKLKNIADGFNKRINMPSSNTLLKEAKSRAETYKSPSPILTFVKKNIAAVIVAVMLTGTVLGMFSYYMVSGPLSRGTVSGNSNYPYYPEGYPMSIEEFNELKLTEYKPKIKMLGLLLNESDVENALDGILDDIQDEGFTEFNSREDLLIDDDGDGLPNWLDPDSTNQDTDGDGLYDGVEFFLKLDALKSNAGKSDLDGDGVPDLDELLVYSTDPLCEDSDGDGLNDYEEIYKYGTDPLREDTDGDGVFDGVEVKVGLDPTLTDSDNNGIADRDEYIKYEIYESEQTSKDIKVSLSFSGKAANLNGQFKTLDIKNTDNYSLFPKNTVGYIAGTYEAEFDKDSDSEYYITFELSNNISLSENAEPKICYVSNTEQSPRFLTTEKIGDKKYSAKISDGDYYYALLDNTEWEKYQSYYESIKSYMPEQDISVFTFDGNKFYGDINPVQNFLFVTGKDDSGDEYIKLSAKDGFISDYKIMELSFDDYLWSEAEYELTDDGKSAVVTVSQRSAYCICYK